MGSEWAISFTKLTWEEWPSGLGVTIRIGRFPVQTQLGAQLGLGTQPRSEAQDDLRLTSS